MFLAGLIIGLGAIRINLRRGIMKKFLEGAGLATILAFIVGLFSGEKDED